MRHISCHTEVLLTRGSRLRMRRRLTRALTPSRMRGTGRVIRGRSFNIQSPFYRVFFFKASFVGVAKLKSGVPLLCARAE